MYPPALMHAPFDLVRSMMSTQRSKSKLAGSSSVKVSWVHRFAAAMSDFIVGSCPIRYADLRSPAFTPRGERSSSPIGICLDARHLALDDDDGWAAIADRSPRRAYGRLPVVWPAAHPHARQARRLTRTCHRTPGTWRDGEAQQTGTWVTPRRRSDRTLGFLLSPDRWLERHRGTSHSVIRGRRGRTRLGAVWARAASRWACSHEQLID